MSDKRKPGNKPGSIRTLEPKCCRSIQRYKQKDFDLIREVSGGNVSTFVHDAAVARAKRLSKYPCNGGAAIPAKGE